MRFARALLFNLALYGWTTVLSILMIPILLFPPRAMMFVVHLWLGHVEWIERRIGGLYYRVTGWENVPEGAAIVASKHQSVWETFKVYLLFGDPAVVLKMSLARIPVWGWYLAHSGVIAIDRSRGHEALGRMMKAARIIVAEGRKIVIFPQGTRVAPGARRPYKGGVGALYEALNVPVVPMAHNAGVFWPRNGFMKKPGVITVEFLPPIPPGLPRAAMMKRLEEELEAATEKLIAEAFRQK